MRTQVGHRLRDAGPGDPMRVVDRAELVELDATCDTITSVVMTVVGALDLDDERRDR